MSNVRLYGAWDASYILGIIGYTVRENAYLNLLENLEDYLETNGTKVGEKEYKIEHKDNLWTIYTDIRFLSYKLDNATVFVRHKMHTDNWPPFADPDRETVAIRISSQDSMDKLIEEIKDRLKLLPHVSEQPQKIVPYGMPV